MKKISEHSLVALFMCLSILMGISSCDTPNVEHRYMIQGEAQGTYYAITYYGTQPPAPLKIEIDSLLHAFDMSLSTYHPNSLISRFNASDTGIVPDQWLRENIELAQEVSAHTQGMFDITIGPVAAYWGFGHLPPPSAVVPAKVDSLLQFVGYNKIHLEQGLLKKDRPEIQINCNAIAQGYSVDVVSHYLQNKGIEAFIVDVGGEIYAHNTKPEAKRWTVGIEMPQKGSAERVYKASIHLQDEAIATSGNYRKFFEIEGTTYVHSINPKTAYPVKNNVLSATVIAPTAAMADAYATACMMLGVEDAVALAQAQPELKIYIMYNKQGQIATAMSQNFKKYLE